MRNLGLLPLLLVSACAMGPDYKRPETAAPAAGAFQTTVKGTSPSEPDGRWWRLYDDPALDRLIERGLEANTDLRIARANLLRAQAVVREARAGTALTGDVSAGTNYGDDMGFPGGPQGGQTQWSYNGSITANWELDLFGRIGRTIEATRADAAAEEAVRDSVALTVAAEVARAYVDACALAEAIVVARESSGIAERELTIQRTRQRVGAGSDLDIQRSATALANVRATLPTLEGRRRASLFELAALIGATPSEVPQEVRDCARVPAPVSAIPLGDGRSLLARRPDVREAERRLAADTARIGVATADLYPRVSLGGSGNFFRNNQVRGSNAFSFALGPLISWSWPNLLVGRSLVEQADASAQASLASFDGAVVNALKEVEQALSFYAAEGERNYRLQEAAGHADAAYRLASRRYSVGSIAFLELLDTQRELVDARSAFADSTQRLGSLRVDVFKALGSGWEPAASGGNHQ